MGMLNAVALWDNHCRSLYSVTWDSSTGASFSAGAAMTTAVGGLIPEPTSGLLMLLGVAGLALRRRRA